MRRAPGSRSNSTIAKTIGELIDRLTGEIETSIDARALALVSSWTEHGVSARSISTMARSRVANRSARAPNALAPRPMIPLPRAERDFRVSYLRALLAEVPNRREAARRAGVPYRTLCDMVRKLRIQA